ncbi:MAG TPA: sulfotransferase [Micromonosporaceae bacterium]|nr:sulfotransferase [Micromonosporaceae bacterium]
MPSDRPILVVGSPRSGTTMLQLMLHAHPRIAIPPESRFVLAGVRRQRSWGDLRDPANRRRFAEWLTHDTRTNFADLELDAEAVIQEIVDEATTLGSAMGIVFRAYARRFGKPRWGDKRPSYLLNLDVLLRLFPDAQIVNIIRDGRDCVASTTEQPWHRGGLHEAIATWCRAADAGWQARRELPAHSYHELYYEALVADPVGHMKAVCDFLSEDFVEDITSPAVMADVAVPERKVWHELTHGDVVTSRVGTFAERLRPDELALCQAVMASRLVRHGYQLVDTDRPTVRQRAGYLPMGARTWLSSAKHGAALRRTLRSGGEDPLASRLTNAGRVDDLPGNADEP